MSTFIPPFHHHYLIITFQTSGRVFKSTKRVYASNQIEDDLTSI